MLKWYNRKIDDTCLTGPDKVVLVIVLFIACALCLWLAGFLITLMPEFVSGELIFLYWSFPQRVGFIGGFIVFTALLGLLCGYTAVKFITKETIK